MKIRIHPDQLKHFSEKQGVCFILVTNSHYKDCFSLEPSSQYKESLILFRDNDEESMMQFIRRHKQGHVHALIISPKVFYTFSKDNELDQEIQLLTLMTHSTPTDFFTIQHILNCMQKSDPEDQMQKAEQLFQVGQESELFQFVHKKLGLQCTLNHLDEGCVWNEQLGYIRWGEQQFAPSGEVAMTHKNRIPLTGEILLEDEVIVHKGGLIGLLDEDQKAIYTRLASCKKGGVVINIANGEVVETIALSAAANPCKEMLDALMMTDSRYTIICEIGFSVNRFLEVLSGNHAMNETFAQENGSIHIGFGAAIHVPYHIDFLCPGLQVRNEKNKLLFG